MHIYLGKLYPVNPYSRFEVFQMDSLDEEKYQDLHNEFIQDELRELLDCYIIAKERHNIRGEIVYYNNSSWYFGAADNMFDFVKDMRQALDDTRKEN